MNTTPETLESPPTKDVAAERAERTAQILKARELDAVPVVETMWPPIFRDGPKLGKADGEKLEQFAAEDSKLVASIIDHSPTKAKEAWLRQQQDLTEAIASGNKGPVDLYSAAEYADDFTRRRTALKQRRSEIRDEAVALLKPIFEKVAAHVGELIERQIEAEQKEFASYGVPYAEGPLVTALRAAQHRLLHHSLESSFFSGGLSKQIINLLRK